MEIQLKGERGDFLLKEFIKCTFPSEEYRMMHADKISEFLDYIAFHSAHGGIHADSTKAIEIFKFLADEGVDLKKWLNLLNIHM